MGSDNPQSAIRNPQSGGGRWPALGVLCLLLLAAAACGQAPKAGKDKDRPKDINVDFNIGWGECYRPMEWTPLRVGISSPFKKPMDCLIEISASQDDLNNLVISRREVIEPDRPREIPLVTKLAYAVSDCTVYIRDTQSGYTWSRKYQLWDRRMDQRTLTAVTVKDLLIGAAGRQAFGLMQLPQASCCESPGERGAGYVPSRGRRMPTGPESPGERGTVYTKYVFQRLLPADWTGYASLDLLVLYDPEWTELRGYPAQAIAQWVHNGGRLLVILGGRALPPDHPIAKLLPFQIDPPKELTLSSGELASWGCQNWEKDKTKVACWTLTAAEQARGWVTRTDRGMIRWAHGPVGFGRVGLLAFDPSPVGGRQGPNLAGFWVDYMRPLLDKRTIAASERPQDNDSPWHYRLDEASAATNAVLEHLYSVEELRPIHIGWVVLVLSALAVLIGPVDYLVLKKLGRLPLTWVTASACIALFSVGAYYGVEYLRGGVLQARVVSVIDGVAGAPSAWCTRYLGIFAPHSDDYRLEGPDRSQWWAGMSPTQGDDLYGYRERIGTRNIYCAQHVDGGNIPFSVPINIWAMQCLSSESHLPGHPLEATVRFDSQRQEWVATVKNLTDSPIAEAYLLVGGSSSMPLGPVPARGQREFRGRSTSWPPWESQVQHIRQDPGPGGREATRYVAQTALCAEGTSQRTDAIYRYLRDGAVVVCAEFDAAAVPFAMKGMNCRFQHKQVARLVVFPEGKG